MTNIGRPSVWDKHSDEMGRMYEAQCSRGEIAKHFGTSVQTVTRVLVKAGVVFEDRPRNSNAGRTAEQQAAINVKVSVAKTGVLLGPRKPAETRECEQCHVGYEYRPGKTGERFCSRQCRTDFLVARNKAGAEAEYELEPRRCRCGTAIPYEYRHTRQFCSPGCRLNYGVKRQIEEDKYITFNCLNCGTEVHRRKKYGSGASKYCSNECSATHNKTRRFYALEDFDEVFESSYEMFFFSLCMLLKLPVERADRLMAVNFGYDLVDDVAAAETAEEKTLWYCPDFWLPTLGLFVETKGLEDDDDRARYAAWREAGRPLLVLDRDGLLELLQTVSAYGLEQELFRMTGRQVVG